MELNKQNNPESDTGSAQEGPVSAQQVGLRAGPGVLFKNVRRFSLVHVVVLLNVLMLAGFGTFAIIMFQRLAKVQTVPEVRIIHSQADASGDDELNRKKSDGDSFNVVSVMDENETSAPQEAISLETACSYYRQKAYSKAYVVFEKLQENISGRLHEQQSLRDWLSLQMALCLYYLDPQSSVSDHFNQPLNSRSLYVRALANYYLSRIQHEKQNYLESRSRAYKALGLLDVVSEYLPEKIESDCYFTAVESLTCYILSLSNQDFMLPGQFWTGTRPLYDCLITDQQQLTKMLLVGTEEIDRTALGPKVEYYPDRMVGSQWTGMSFEAPLEQLFWRIASEADLAVSWHEQALYRRLSPTTVYLPFVDRQYLLEVIAASAGLIWRFDGQVGMIHDPEKYQDIQRCHEMMCGAAVSAWQRFLIRYRSDSRVANAHYCLGRLYEVYDDPSTALGHYKLTYSQFNRNDLASYALLNAGRIKIDLQDYTGAREDLNELLVHHPDFKMIGDVVLHLADATLKCGLYDEAAQLYERAYRMDASEEVCRSALFGRGQCAYETEDFEGCVKWLGEAVKITSDLSDVRRGPACLMLGRSFGKLGHYAQASCVLQMALGGTLAHEDYVQILIELAKAECGRENYIEALNILEGSPQDKLSQEDICRVLLVKTDIYTMLQLTDAAISLLRRQIEFIADARLRAQLSMELAHCYMLNGDLEIAERELNDAMYDLPHGFDTWRGGYLLARLAFLQEKYDKAQVQCLQTLQIGVQDTALKNQLYELLGQIYTRKKDYNNAALAFAGLVDEGRLN